MPIKLNGSSSGFTQIDAASVAGNNTLTLPTASGTLMTTGGTNTFTANQVIEVTDDTNAALRITQLGTGAALLVEDSANPDSTPFIVDASGSVGIGTASPQSALNVVVNSSSTSIGGSTAVAQIGNSNSSALGLTAGIELFASAAPSSGNGNRSAGIYGIYESYNASGNAGALSFATNPAGTTSVVERMRIDSSGNVGIGTGSPSNFGGTNLQVQNSTIGSILWSNGTITGQLLASASAEVTVGSRSNHPLRLGTNDTERMRIDTSGNVGIGTGSPNARLDVRGGNGTGGISGPASGTWASKIVMNQDSSGYSGLSVQSRWADDTTPVFEVASGWNGSAAGYYPIYTVNGTGVAVWKSSNGTERMRIDSNGKVLVGTSSTFIGASNLQIASSLNEQIAIRSTAAAAGRCWRFTADNNNTTYIINQDTVGVYIPNGSTTWSSLSDERAKDIIEPISDAASKVSTLRAVIGKYKTDEEGKRRSFLIAQDVQAVLPEAVSVADQETGYLGLSYTDTIPLLTAALQEALTKIDALEARLAALENA